MIFFSAITAISLIGMMIIVLKHLTAVRMLSEDIMHKKLSQMASLKNEIWLKILLPTYKKIHSNVLPKIYIFAERFIEHFRSLLLKLEKKLEHITNYLRGRRSLSNGNEDDSKNFDYWKTINKHQNSAKESREDRIE